MTLTDFIFDTLKEIVNDYNSKPMNKASQNRPTGQSDLKKYPYSKNGSSSTGKKRLISEQFVREEIAAGRNVVVSEGDIVTPSARDMLNKKNKY